MKQLSIIGFIIIAVSIFAQQGVNVRIQQNGLDIADLSDFHFSAELVPESGDFQYETDFANGFNFLDVGMGFPNSYLNFDLSNFAGAWEDAMDFELIVWQGSDPLDGVSIILNCGFIAAGFSYYGWGFYDGDEPLEVPINNTSFINSIENINILNNNYPNPFNPVTTINFSVKENETGILTIYNAKGQVVTNETFASGVHNYNWNADKYSSGIYFYKLQTASFSEVKKMLLIK